MHLVLQNLSMKTNCWILKKSHQILSVYVIGMSLLLPLVDKKTHIAVINTANSPTRVPWSMNSSFWWYVVYTALVKCELSIVNFPMHSYVLPSASRISRESAVMWETRCNRRSTANLVEIDNLAILFGLNIRSNSKIISASQIWRMAASEQDWLWADGQTWDNDYWLLQPNQLLDRTAALCSIGFQMESYSPSSSSCVRGLYAWLYMLHKEVLHLVGSVSYVFAELPLLQEQVIGTGNRWSWT